MASGMDKFALADLIGKPFEYKGRGPDKYDCYGLLREIYKRQGLDIPDYESPTEGARIAAIFALELRLWEEVPKQPGTSVLIRVPGNLHVGYVLPEDKMIHTWEESNGVVIESLDVWKRRIKGYYKYVG